MRILLLSNKAPYPSKDGSAIAIWQMATGLSEAGAEVHLLTLNTRKHFKPDEGVPAEWRSKLHYQSVSVNTDIQPLAFIANLLSNQSYFVSRFDQATMREALIEKLTTNTFDWVQLEGLFMCHYIDLIRKHSKARIALRMHNVEHRIWEHHLASESSFLKRTYLNIQVKRLKQYELNSTQKVDALIPISKEDAAWAKPHAPGIPLHFSPTGMVLRDRNKAPLQENSVFHFASMDWLPNQEALRFLLDEIWPIVIKRKPEAILYVAGRAMPPAFFEYRLPGLTLEGEVDSAEKVYTSHDIMVVPLKSGSGIRIKLIEGMAHGKVIVSTALGAAGSGMLPGIHYLEANTAEAFAEAIVYLLENPHEKARLAASATAHLQEGFDNVNLSKRILEFLQSIPNA
jgi:polysaccharide biosynthesis protein PslH